VTGHLVECCAGSTQKLVHDSSWHYKCEGAPSPSPPSDATDSVKNVNVTIPSGVNTGGWLCLEDWFFSGDAGRIVATGKNTPQGQGACLPPLVQQLDSPWASEGELTYRLNATHGPKNTSEIFMAHRRNFMAESRTSDHELANMAKIGVKNVRVPMTWAAFADALSPINNRIYGSHNPDTEAVVVPDPFYADSRAMVTVPRTWLAEFLRKASDNGLKVVLDLHAFPGGSSEGTYNGIWPLQPVFWNSSTTVGQDEHHNVPLTDAGHMIVNALIHWVESLGEVERSTVSGITVMNEPAHMSAWGHWASESQVLAWLATASDAFRQSKLPTWGTKLYMNVIETAFKNFDGTVAPWWVKTFSQDERTIWAVMDRHWYSAWGGGGSSGRTVPGGRYLCNQPHNEIRAALRQVLSGWGSSFAQKFPGLRATSEFSLGTYDQAWAACKDRETLDVFMQEQLRSFEANSIEPFFWTWRMPYGPAFEPGWSLKHHANLESPSLPLCLAPQRTGEELVV